MPKYFRASLGLNAKLAGRRRKGDTADSCKPKVRKICQRHFSIFQQKLFATQHLLHSLPLPPVAPSSLLVPTIPASSSFHSERATKYAKARVNWFKRDNKLNSGQADGQGTPRIVQHRSCKKRYAWNGERISVKVKLSPCQDELIANRAFYRKGANSRGCKCKVGNKLKLYWN